MELIIFNKLKEKFQSLKKSKEVVDEDSTEVTGKYDLEELEEEEAPKSGLEKFVESQLPFLAKFLPKRKPAYHNDEELEDFEEDDLEEEYEDELEQEGLEAPDSKAMEAIKKQLPFAYNFIKKIQASKGKKSDKPKKEDAPKDGAKQKKVKPIHIIIGLGLVYLFYAELFIPKDEDVTDPVVEDIPAPTPAPTPSPAPEPEVPSEPDFVDEEPFEPTPAPAPIPEPEYVPTVEEDVTPPMDDEPEEPTWDDITPSADTPSDEFNFDIEEDDQTPEEPVGGEQSTDGNLLENDEIEEQDITTSILRNLEDKVRERKEVTPVESLEPTEAPDYDYKGRALVYNCQGGHWACVDDESFRSCRKNYAWNSSQNIEKECYASEVYASEADCARAQTMKIDSVSKTDFCN